MPVGALDRRKAAVLLARKPITAWISLAARDHHQEENSITLAIAMPSRRRGDGVRDFAMGKAR